MTTLCRYNHMYWPIVCGLRSQAVHLQNVDNTFGVVSVFQAARVKFAVYSGSRCVWRNSWICSFCSRQEMSHLEESNAEAYGDAMIIRTNPFLQKLGSFRLVPSIVVIVYSVACLFLATHTIISPKSGWHFCMFHIQIATDERCDINCCMHIAPVLLDEKWPLPFQDWRQNNVVAFFYENVSFFVNYPILKFKFRTTIVVLSVVLSVSQTAKTNRKPWWPASASRNTTDAVITDTNACPTPCSGNTTKNSQ